MGNSNQNQSFLKKGQGLRILSVKLNSPFDGKVEPFFDFIIDIIPMQPERSPKQILDKLSDNQGQKGNRKKQFQQIINDNQNKKIQFKIVSTKTRNVRSIQITPNRNWNGSMDLIGIQIRKQKFDQVFDTYFPVVDIGMNSPIQQSGVKQGQYLLGCVEFQYISMNGFVEMLYDRYFDKQIKDKHIHLALYDIMNDEVNIKPVLLKRGWGGQGLLGCEFLQGQVYKFPHNLKERRQALLAKHKLQMQNQKLKNQLGQCDGSSKTLVEVLKNKDKTRKTKHMQTIKNMIKIPLPQINSPSQLSNKMVRQQQGQTEHDAKTLAQQNIKIQILSRKVQHLQGMLLSIRQYLDDIQKQQQDSVSHSEQKRTIHANKYNNEQ